MNGKFSSQLDPTTFNMLNRQWANIIIHVRSAVITDGRKWKKLD